jgi:hypothetical protein
MDSIYSNCRIQVVLYAWKMLEFWYLRHVLIQDRTSIPSPRIYKFASHEFDNLIGRPYTSWIVSRAAWFTEGRRKTAFESLAGFMSQLRRFRSPKWAALIMIKLFNLIWISFPSFFTNFFHIMTWQWRHHDQGAYNLVHAYRLGEIARQVSSPPTPSNCSACLQNIYPIRR